MSLLVQGATVRWRRAGWVSRCRRATSRVTAQGVGGQGGGGGHAGVLRRGRRQGRRRIPTFGHDHPGHDMRCVALVREGSLPPPNPRHPPASWRLGADDRADRNLRTARAHFRRQSRRTTANASFFGDRRKPDSRQATSPTPTACASRRPSAELAMGSLAVRLGRPPVVGDRVNIGAFALTVREIRRRGRIAALASCHRRRRALRRAAIAAQMPTRSAVRAAAAAML